MSLCDIAFLTPQKLTFDADQRVRPEPPPAHQAARMAPDRQDRRARHAHGVRDDLPAAQAQDKSRAASHAAAHLRRLRAESGLSDGNLTALLPTDDNTVLEEEGMTTQAPSSSGSNIRDNLRRLSRCGNAASRNRWSVRYNLSSSCTWRYCVSMIARAGGINAAQLLSTRCRNQSRPSAKPNWRTRNT